MGLFQRLFRKEKVVETPPSQVDDIKKEIIKEDINPIPDWADPDISNEEKELVAVIASAGLANSLPDKRYRVKTVYKVDEDWIVAGIAAISGVSQGNENEKYRIKSIKRVR